MGKGRQSGWGRSQVALSFVPRDSDEFTLIDKIAERAVHIERASNRNVRRGAKVHHQMNLSACHASGNPLRLADLLAADDFNFAHDVFGIDRHIDRGTGQLLDCFSPRFSDRVPA